MEFSMLPPDPVFDVFFRNRLTSTIEHFGSDGFRLVASGQDFCPRCGFRLPPPARHLIRSRPIFCRCGRLLMDAHYDHADLFATLFTDAKHALVIARPEEATAN